MKPSIHRELRRIGITTAYTLSLCFVLNAGHYYNTWRSEQIENARDSGLLKTPQEAYDDAMLKMNGTPPVKNYTIPSPSH